MGKETVDALVEGGKASAAPPLGSSLGPMKVNIGQVVSEINEKTKIFKGMKVPVKVIVDTDTKEFKIEVGTPPITQLIKKEVNLEIGSGEPNKLKVGDIAFEQVIKLAKMKQDAILANNFKAAVKTVIGVCGTMGILIDGKDFKTVIKEVNEGKYDELIKEEKTEISEERKAELDKINKELQNLIGKKLKFDKIIAVADTPTTLACIKKGTISYNEALIEGDLLTQSDLENFINQLAVMNSVEIKNKFKSVVDGREDVLLAGTMLLFEVMNFFKATELVVSTKGVRYGAIYELFF